MPVTIPDWLPGGGTVIGPPDAQTQPTDTSQRDALIKQLADAHRGQIGSSSQVLTKDAEGKDQHYYDKYTFGDGSSVEIAPTGQVQNIDLKTDKTVAGYTDITQVRNADQTISYYGRDPADGQMKKVPGLPDSAAPESTKTTPTATAQLDRIDKNGNDATQSGLPPVSLRDPKTGTVIDVPKDPSGSVTAVGDTMYVIKPDGSSTPVLGPDGKPLTKPKDPSQFNVPGVGLVNYDPSTQKASVLIPTPKGVQAGQLKPEVRNGVTYMPVDDGNGGVVWTEAKQQDGSPLPTDVIYTMASNDPRSPTITLVDNQGNSKQVSKGPDWKPPPSPAAGQALTPDTTAPYVVTIGDNGLPVFTDNTNRISITDATRQFIDSLGTHVAAGSMSEAQAQDLIKNITAGMTARATAQNAQANALQGMAQATTGQLNAISQGAQTGAGILQNRVTAATGALQNLVGQAAGAKNLMNVPAGLGDQLVGGLQGWATQLGGGQDVYDSAANLVKRADPGNALGGDAATAYGALGQMLQKYRDLTGQPHPAEVVAAQQQPNTGFTAPAAAAPATPAMPNIGGPYTGGLPAIGNNPMLAAQQMYNRNQAAQQLAQATAQANMPFGAIGANPMGSAFTSPMTIAPPAQTVTM